MSKEKPPLATFFAGRAAGAGAFFGWSAEAMAAALPRSWATALSVLVAGWPLRRRPPSSRRKKAIVACSVSAWAESSSEVAETCSEAAAFCCVTLSSCWIAWLIWAAPTSC
jgi:hypothetical protein